ncbi:Uncharacterized protein TCAP_04546 [Tolypocladium capitatum]|uniref:Uncharacterized protein n=1 Tax=Tolypocladium capitatum TaxID=45235 RepID=A0A2K3QDA6_9HYPO|nr:Uncharacterized protein TCAP_04546 [Tolypocladium capitatum]
MPQASLMTVPAIVFSSISQRRQLWQSLVVRPESEYRVDRIPSMIPKGIPLHYVRALHIRSTFDRLPAYRCIHWDSQPRLHHGMSMRGKDRVNPDWHRWNQLMLRLWRILSKFEHGQLLCFSHCVGGADRFQVSSLAKVRFDELGRLSWTGPPNGLILGAFIHSQVKRLEELRIEWPPQSFLDRVPMDEEYWLIPVIIQDTGEISYPITPPMLRGLRALCLCKIPLCEQFLAQILDFNSLESLTFRECRGWDKVVGHTLRQRGRKPLNLRSFEIQDSVTTWRYCDSLITEWEWLLLLELVEGLEELFISLKVRRPVPNRTLWRHVAKHGATLSKYVQHYRAQKRTEYIPELSKTLDLESWGLDNGQHEALESFVARLDVDCLGVAGGPPCLRQILGPFAAKRTLRFLHIRQTVADLGYRDPWAVMPYPSKGSGGADESPNVSPSECSIDSQDLGYNPYDDVFDTFQITEGDLSGDFLDLVEWAFSPGGIHSLDTVAYGDFASGRNRNHNFILRRDAASMGGFRFVKPQDWEGRCIINEHRRVLEACPISDVEDLLADTDAKIARTRYDQMHAPYGSSTPSPLESPELDSPPGHVATERARRDDAMWKWSGGS